MRFEISNVDEKVVKRIKKWCIENNKKHGNWAEIAHNALVNKA
jgi:hypothetical protein